MFVSTFDFKVSLVGKTQPRCDGPSVGASFAVKVYRTPVSSCGAWDVIGINGCFASAMKQHRLCSLQPLLLQKAMAFSDSKNTPPKCIKTSSVIRSHGPTCCRHTVVAVCIGGRKSILGGEPSVCFVLKVHFLEIQVVTVTSIQVALAVAAGSQKSQHSGLRPLAWASDQWHKVYPWSKPPCLRILGPQSHNDMAAVPEPWWNEPSAEALIQFLVEFEQWKRT